MEILKVNGTVFEVTPTSITPNYEIIKNTERAISGKLCVDIVGKKENLTINWALVNNAQFVKIKGAFNVESIIKAQYHGQAIQEDYCLDSFSYTPTVINGELFWQDVNVTLIVI